MTITTITHRIARYIALPIVSAGLIGGAVLGMAGMANAAEFVAGHQQVARCAVALVVGVQFCHDLQRRVPSVFAVTAVQALQSVQLGDHHLVQVAHDTPT